MQPRQVPQLPDPRPQRHPQEPGAEGGSDPVLDGWGRRAVDGLRVVPAAQQQEAAAAERKAGARVCRHRTGALG